jgi:putative DNA primase/helicase
MDDIEEFKGAIRAHGLNPPEIIEPGKLHRFPTNCRASDDAGWCKLFPDCEGGVFGDFRSGLSETWQAQRKKPFTSAEREAFRQRCEAERCARQAEEARHHAEAAKKARSVWAAATSLREPHPHLYLLKKGVAPVPELREIHADAVKEIIGYRPQSRDEFLVGRLLVARIQAGDELVSVELIDEAGHKSALAGGPKKGGYWLAQELPDGDGQGLVLLLGERHRDGAERQGGHRASRHRRADLWQPADGGEGDPQALPGSEAGHPRRSG